MPKVPTTIEKPKALDMLTSIAEEALDFRYQDRAPNLVDIGRTVLAGSDGDCEATATGELITHALKHRASRQRGVLCYGQQMAQVFGGK